MLSNFGRVILALQLSFVMIQILKRSFVCVHVFACNEREEMQGWICVPLFVERAKLAWDIESSLSTVRTLHFSLYLSLSRALFSLALHLPLSLEIPYSCELWYRIQGRLVWCSGQLWRPLRESFRAWCFVFTTNILSRVDGRTVCLILQFMYYAGFVPNPGSSPAVFSNMAQIFLQYCFQTWPLRKIFAKIETLRVGNVASCSEKTKPFIGNTQFLDSDITENFVRVCKDRNFLQENKTIYCNP